MYGTSAIVIILAFHRFIDDKYHSFPIMFKSPYKGCQGKSELNRIDHYAAPAINVCFVGVKDSEDEEEENNTSPVKRPASLMSGKKPPLVATSFFFNQFAYRAAFNSKGKLSQTKSFDLSKLVFLTT